MRSTGRKRTLASGAALISRILGCFFVGISVCGIWVARSVSQYAATDVLGGLKGKLDSTIFLLSWLVLFGPFLFFGVALVLSSFAPEERSWLIPLRVFTYLMGRRFSAERQRSDLPEDSAAKTLPQAGTQQYIDVQPASSSVSSSQEKKQR